MVLGKGIKQSYILVKNYKLYMLGLCTCLYQIIPQLNKNISLTSKLVNHFISLQVL